MVRKPSGHQLNLRQVVVGVIILITVGLLPANQAYAVEAES